VRRLFLLVILIIGGLGAFAQGSIQISYGPGVQGLIDAHIRYNKTQTTLDGYRVMLKSTNDRSNVQDLKSKFILLYPDVWVDWEYIRPLYKLKAGAFLTKLEAQRFVAELSHEFPGAYITRAKISPSEL